MKNVSYNYTEGITYPLGANCRDGGVNFSVFSSIATKIDLLLFHTRKDTKPFQIIELTKKDNFDFGFWHVFVEKLKAGTCYAYRVYGTNENFENKILLDPYAKGIDDYLWDISNALITDNSDNIATSMRGCVLDTSGYNWEGVKKPNIPLKETIIYEMHVKGFTKSPTSKVKHPGTYVGLIDKIPYLKKLGITTVELLPVMQFDEKEPNYWGYNTVGFFAPHSAYCISDIEANQVNEFRDMVKALHRAGIEVVLDVVYNHTREGNESGPIINFKGFDNKLYYSFDENGNYQNFSGCGNSMSCNHPIVQKLILESLEFWAIDMQVDGFRFDLGTILTLDSKGNVMEYPPVLWEIELRDTLTDCKLIAEPWAAEQNEEKGLYQLGKVNGYRWSQWNDKYKICIRNFVKGEPGIIKEVATRILGSPDLYEASGHLPTNSVNFITCHDGLTLNDLVSYTNNYQCSWDCGITGETDDETVNKLREQQMKNFIAILFLSKGIPMMLSGDELKMSQKGIDNGYVPQYPGQGWLDWNCIKEDNEIFKFFQKMILLRKQTYFLQTKHFFTGEVCERHTRGLKDITWHGKKLNSPEWDNSEAKTLAFTISGIACKNIYNYHEYENPQKFKDEDIHTMMNMDFKPVTFEIPQIKGRQWFVYTDTSQKINSDEILHLENTYTVQARSIVILVSR